MERDSLSRRPTREEQSAARELQSAFPDWRQGVGGLLGREFTICQALYLARVSHCSLTCGIFLIRNIVLLVMSS